MGLGPTATVGFSDGDGNWIPVSPTSPLPISGGGGGGGTSISGTGGAVDAQKTDAGVTGTFTSVESSNRVSIDSPEIRLSTGAGESVSMGGTPGLMVQNSSGGIAIIATNATLGRIQLYGAQGVTVGLPFGDTAGRPSPATGPGTIMYWDKSLNGGAGMLIVRDGADWKNAATGEVV